MDLRTQRVIDNYLGRLGIAVLRPCAMLLGAVLRRDHTLIAGREIVWIKMLGGGSLLIAMPMLLAMRRAFPETRMVLVTTPSVRPFAELTGVFDEIRVIDPGSAARLAASAARVWWSTLRADCIVDLEVHSRLTTVFTTLTMARNRVSFWLEDIFWRRGLASHLVYFNLASGSYHFYDRIGELFGTPVAPRDECRAAVLAACGATEAPARAPEQVAVGFACSDLASERMLSPAQWASVFRAQRRPIHRRFLFLGGPADRARAQAIVDAVAPDFPDLIFENRCGASSLAESALAIFGSGEFWGIDSALLHVARIAGTRSVSYWGPSNPETRLRTNWTLDETMHYRKIACSPCVHTTEVPPCHGDNRCIRGLFAPHEAPESWTPVAYPTRGIRDIR